MAEKRTKLTLTVNVRLDQAKEKELPDVTAYVFNATGRFIAAAPVPKGEQGQVKLELASEYAGAKMRVVLGPPLMEEAEELPAWMEKLIYPDDAGKGTPSLSRLSRKGSYEKGVRLDAAGSILNLVVLPSDWKKWLICPYIVQGRVIKRVPLPDGTTRELGVCHACVKIYEVNKIPRIILRLPDYDLFRLRDELRRMLMEPPPMTGVATQVIPLPPPDGRSILTTGAQAMLQADVACKELEPVFRASSATQLRNALTAAAEILAVHICAIDWLWYRLSADFIKCCCTYEQGRFKTTIWYRCAGDKPDLYFKVVQCICGHLHTLYDPGMACHTHWNYVCGAEVALETGDPAAITCIPEDPVDLPAGVSLWVMPYAVGGIRLDQIRPRWQKNLVWHVADADDGKYGLTNFTDGNGTWTDAPFGGTLGFRHGYSSDIPFDVAGKPALYRWLYNKLDGSGHETEWREFAPPVAETVVRHYVDEDLTHPELPPTFPAYPLGPQEKNSMHLYEFKPHQPPAAPGHKRSWPVDDWFNDIYTGILQSAALPGGVANAAGRYKIKLEIYDKNAALINPGPGAFDFIVPTGIDADGVTVLSRKADPAEIEGGGFVFNLHIDNNNCEAEIYEAEVNDVPAGPCGFIGYEAGDDVHLSYKAWHPNGFARFKFTVVLGSSGYKAAACAPADPGGVAWADSPLVTDSPNGFVHDAAGVFTKDVDESDLRGGCDKAAFGENLYVAAAATNGWVRLSGLDASAVPKAFALEPKPVPGG